MSLITEREIENRLQNMLNKGISKYLVAGVGLMYSGGLRVSDMLKINYSNISVNLIITVRQGKGSDSLSLQPIYLREVWREIYDKKMSPFGQYDRFFMYRLFKRFDLRISNGHGRNMSVTHSARKYLANAVYQHAGDIDNARKTLGHKSANSTKYYIDKDYRKAVLQRGIEGSGEGGISNIVIQKNNIIRITRLPIRRKSTK